jgi:poly-beta-1,6-N-acetyl-D-glucosamine synthase
LASTARDSRVATRNAETSDHPLHRAVVGVLVHNEEPNIETCLRAILGENVGSVSVGEVIVVSSGSTDRTEEIVRRIAAEDHRVWLISESRRTGKASALNILLRHSRQPFVVLLGGDVVFTPGSLVRLLEPFRDSAVGMTGVRPIPTNARRGVMGNVVHILWDMHHELSQTKPKLGEAVAFRRILQDIDSETLVDEAMLEHIIIRRGLRLQYVPSAVVRNHGPETLREFMVQRTRIYRGHLNLASATGYRVSSMNAMASGRAAWRLLRRRVPARYLLLALGMETAARARARWSRPDRSGLAGGVWEVITSSKVVVERGHVLRAHHDGFSRLLVPAAAFGGGPERPNIDSLAAKTRRHVRVEDLVSINGAGLTVTCRGDHHSALAVYSRLAAEIPLVDTADTAVVQID